MKNTRWGTHEGPRVDQMSEEEILQRVLPPVRPHSHVLVGPGDDAAVLRIDDGPLVLCTDALVEDQDFRLVWPNGYHTSGYDVGWKAAAANVSDLAAMGAAARALVVSLVLPPDAPVAWVRDLTRGLVEACENLGAGECPIVGGDLSAGGLVSIDVTAVGDARGAQPVLRSGARAGQIVAVAGHLGRAAAGWALLEGSRPYEVLGEGERACVDVFLRPTPPVQSGGRAGRVPAAAMMDISDGLLKDAHRLAHSSGVRVELERSALQVFIPPLADVAHAMQADPWDWVLAGGEDYALLSTFEPEDWPVPGFTPIGWIGSKETGEAVHIEGQPENRRGWDHFAPTGR